MATKTRIKRPTYDCPYCNIPFKSSVSDLFIVYTCRCGTRMLVVRDDIDDEELS